MNLTRYAVIVGFVAVLPWRAFYAMAKAYYTVRSAKKTEAPKPEAKP